MKQVPAPLDAAELSRRELLNIQYEDRGRRIPHPEVRQPGAATTQPVSPAPPPAPSRNVEDRNSVDTAKSQTEPQTEPKVGDAVRCVGGEEGTVMYVYSDGACQVKLAGGVKRVKVAQKQMTVIENVENKLEINTQAQAKDNASKSDDGGISKNTISEGQQRFIHAFNVAVYNISPFDAYTERRQKYFQNILALNNITLSDYPEGLTDPLQMQACLEKLQEKLRIAELRRDEMMNTFRCRETEQKQVLYAPVYYTYQFYYGEGGEHHRIRIYTAPAMWCGLHNQLASFVERSFQNHGQLAGFLARHFR